MADSKDITLKIDDREVTVAFRTTGNTLSRARTQEHQKEKCESQEALCVQQRVAGSRFAVEGEDERSAECENGQQCELRQESIISAEARRSTLDRPQCLAGPREAPNNERLRTSSRSV